MMGDFLAIMKGGTNMEAILSANGLFCTGCGACASVCPVSAISMVHDEEGFIKARIDDAACVRCGRCESTCPVISPDYSNGEPVCHAMEANDDDRRRSSSGGIFPVLARAVLRDGGIVFGAAWNDDFSVSIVGIEDEADLDRLRGSKYVQAGTERTFDETRQALLSGRRVLYSGTPCQIAGLKASLGDLYGSENLLSVEILCHGAPPARLLRDYLDEEFGIGNVRSLSFRDKEPFGWTVTEKVSLSDGSESVQRVGPFMDAFNPCLIMGRACGVCPFAHVPRQADITLGDFWGIEKFRPDLNDLGGLSVVLVSSDRGQRALDGLPEGEVQLDEVVPIEYATEINKTIVHPFENNPGRKHFFMSYGSRPFKELTRVSLEHHYDVGIVGLWYGINYGSILTYYALYEVLRKLGKDPVMLPKPNGLWEDKFNNPDTIAQRFIEPRCNVFQPYPALAEYPFANDNCDAFVLGSDVVWSYDVCGSYVSQFFFLDWVMRDHRKIAYAASIGDGLSDNERYVSEARRNLSHFDFVSARETSGVTELISLTGRDDVQRVLDPVFLYGADAFSEIADQSSGTVAPTGCMFSYILQGEMSAKKRYWVNLIADHLGVEKFVVGNANDAMAAYGIIGEDAILTLPVENWIKSIRDSGFYFGDSYHGLCFALMYHVPFLIAYPDFAPAKSRMTSLLSLLGLEDRIVADAKTPDDEVLGIVDEEIDWEKVDRILAEEAERSFAWLSEALDDDTPLRLTDMDHLHDEMIVKERSLAVETRMRQEAAVAQVEERFERQLEALRSELSDARTRGDEEHRRLIEEIEALRASKSFKVGRAVTWGPRKIADMVNRERDE